MRHFGKEIVMKKFFTTIPLQKEGELKRFVYAAQGNSKLSMDEATSFPIIPAINGYVEPGERFRVAAVVQDNEDAKRNYGYLRQELRALCERKGLTYPDRDVEYVDGPVDQRVSSNVDTFQKLIDLVEDDDELFVCVTYGTKPMSMALLTAIRYAYRLKRNTTVSCVVYGEVDRSVGDWKAKIYDETALVQLDEITRMLAERGVAHPKESIEAILSL